MRVTNGDCCLFLLVIWCAHINVLTVAVKCWRYRNTFFEIDDWRENTHTLMNFFFSLFLYVVVYFILLVYEWCSIVKICDCGAHDITWVEKVNEMWENMWDEVKIKMLAKKIRFKVVKVKILHTKSNAAKMKL